VRGRSNGQHPVIEFEGQAEGLPQVCESHFYLVKEVLLRQLATLFAMNEEHALPHSILAELPK
jgi:hypothetical protein